MFKDIINNDYNCYKQLNERNKYVFTKRNKVKITNKFGYKLNLDYLLIISKYFNTKEDYINLIKVCKKYKYLLESFDYNPISDISLFPNIKVQNFYKKLDLLNNNLNLKHIHWYNIYEEDFEAVNIDNNNIYKNIIYDNIIYYLELRNKCFKIPLGFNLINNNIFNTIEYIDKLSLPITLKNIPYNTFNKTVINKVEIYSNDNNCKEFNCCIPFVIKCKLINKNLKCNYVYFENNDLNCVNIIDNVLIIPNNIFKLINLKNYSFTNVILPDTLNIIENYCFYKTNIKEITIPYSVTRIEDNCFDNCLNLTRIELPSILNNYNLNIFNNTNLLYNILPNYIYKFGYNYIYYTIKLKNLNLELLKNQCQI